MGETDMIVENRTVISAVYHKFITESILSSERLPGIFQILEIIAVPDDTDRIHFRKTDRDLYGNFQIRHIYRMDINPL